MPQNTSDLAPELAVEVYEAMRLLGAQSDLLSIIGSWKDTLDDDEILDMLRDWNACTHGEQTKAARRWWRRLGRSFCSPALLLQRSLSGGWHCVCLRYGICANRGCGRTRWCRRLGMPAEPFGPFGLFHRCAVGPRGHGRGS